ncbi:MAG: hypothetical protein H0V33_09690 [Acidimicrobiia bacterium]|nr:hypothetical protein [Acidimicrobiia bacterium]
MSAPPEPTPPSRRLLVVLATLIVAFWVLGTVATALTPTLLAEHPLLLVALEPRNRNLLLTAERVDPVPFVVFATIRRVASDPIYFALGHLYGTGAVRWVERQVGGAGARSVRFVEKVFARARGPLVFLFPGLLVCVLAGATGMRTRTFLALNLAGTVAVVLALRAFADPLEPVIEPVTDFVEANQTWLTVVTALLVVLWLAWQRARGRSELTTARTLERDLGPTDPDDTR